MNKTIMACAAVATLAGSVLADGIAEGIYVSSFGKTADGRDTKIYRIIGEGGLIIDVSDYGGRLVRCFAPDRYGNMADVTMGWNTAADYDKYGFSAGTLIGRNGNRIAKGKFSIDGVEYQLPVNENKARRYCNLHSGPDGWDKKIWDAKPFVNGKSRGIVLKYVSPDGEGGFPGEVTCEVTYLVSPDNVWSIDYKATTTKPTIVNPTHHSYWNLAGEDSGNVLKQKLQIFADEYTAIDDGLIPVANTSVDGTGFDFRNLREIGAMADWMKDNADLGCVDNWYDHNFVLRGKNGELKKACRMVDEATGRSLEIFTTEPCMQMYGAQNMTCLYPAKKQGSSLCQFAAVALETQHAPDAPNHKEFDQTILRPGQVFHSRTEYHFGVVH